MNYSNIGLEPRLVEYIKTKKFYEENDINTVSLERRFQINKQDLQKITAYYNLIGNSNNNSDRYIKVKNYDDNSDFINPSKSTFPSTNMYDSRLDRINNKIKKEKEANNFRYNTTNLGKTYDMYSRDFSSATSSDFNNEFSLDNIRDELNSELKSNFEPNSNFNFHELVNPPQKHQYHNPPTIQRDQIQPIQRIDRNDFKQNFGNGDNTYRKLTNIPSQKENTFDIDNKVNIPVNNCRKNDLNTLYNEFNNVGNMKNIDYENYIKYGYPTSKARSLGYANASEHYFQFIDDDIQDPKHVVSDRPLSTRLDNKSVARPKIRDIY